MNSTLEGSSCFAPAGHLIYDDEENCSGFALCTVLHLSCSHISIDSRMIKSRIYCSPNRPSLCVI